MNTILTSLDALSREHRLVAKCLVAPNRRVGRQWLDALARRGGPVVNWQLETPVSLAMRLAGPERTKHAGQLAPALLASRLAQQVLGKLRAAGVVEQSPEGYAPALWRTLAQLRQAGISAASVGEGFWAQALIAYQAALDEAKFFDVADLWTWAADAVTASGGAVEGALIVLPQSVLDSASPVARRCWEAITSTSRAILTDVPASATTTGRYDPDRLREAMVDSDLTFHQAVGATMEVRRVFRECLSRGIRLDEVELLYTRSEIYLPIIHEECLRTLETPDAMTSLEGTPVIFTRPARLIKRLCVWAHEGYDQRGFESLVLDGLLDLPEGMTLFEVAGAIRRLRIGGGKERWRTRLAEERSAITARQGDPEQAHRQAWWARQDEVIDAVGTVLERLFVWLEPFESEGVSAGDLFAAIVTILTEVSNHPTQADSLSRQRLVDTFGQLAAWHERYPKSRDREGMLDEIAEVIDTLKIGALGPQPGQLFVAPLIQGGHSGRKHVFIVGMNDHAFPGSVRQDPLLPDGDRKQFNETFGCELPLSGQNVREMIDGFVALLARLEGELQISFASHDMVDDRGLYPATILLPLCAVARGTSSAGLSDLAAQAGAPVSYLPLSPGEATSETFAALTQSPEELATRWADSCEHLARGQRAAEAIADAENFTPWDGNLSEGDAGHKVFSPSRLEALAGCPRRYFFSRVLGLEPPESFETDADTWLDARAYGTLMHGVFCGFYRQVIAENRWSESAESLRSLMAKILGDAVAEIEALYPAPNANARRALLRQARQACAILLSEDAGYASASRCRPRALEVSVGLPVDDEGTDLDLTDPVELTQGLFIRGKIDRIDESTETPGELRLWDYKTGSTWAFRRDPPFDQGRKLQHYMYDRMVRAILPDATIRLTGYFFPGTSGNGERIAYAPEALAVGETLVRQLAALIRTGTYPATDDAGDCTYCEFPGICGDVQAVAAQSGAMLRHCDDPKLAPMRSLRDVEADDE